MKWLLIIIVWALLIFLFLLFWSNRR